jgi:AraC-like DNA-binding protein
MLLKLDFTNLIYFMSVVVGFITGLVLVVYSWNKNRFNLPLAFTFLSLSAAIFFAFLINSGLMYEFPDLYRTGNIFGLIFSPMPFIYILCITQNRTLKWFDLIHFIPVIIYVVDFGPILFLPKEQKLALILSEIQDPNLFTNFNQSRFFPGGFHQNFRIVLINVYWILQLVVLLKWNKNLTRDTSRFEKDWNTWIIFFMALQFFLFAPYYLTFFWLDVNLAFSLVHFSGSILLLTSAVLLFFYPKLLYGLNELKYTSDQIQVGFKENEPERVPDPNEELKLKELGKIIIKWVEEKEVFLKHGYTIQDFARETQIPYYQISACISKSLNTTFADLLNKKRVEYSIKMIQNGILSHYTLEALSKECGFNNRNSFLTAFKKFTGFTPSDYKKQFQNGESFKLL